MVLFVGPWHVSPPTRLITNLREGVGGVETCLIQFFLTDSPLIMIISQMREFLHQFRWKSTLGMKLWWRRAFFFLLWQQNCTSQPEVPQTTEKCRVSKVTMLWSGERNFVEPLLIIMTIYAITGLGVELCGVSAHRHDICQNVCTSKLWTCHVLPEIAQFA